MDKVLPAVRANSRAGCQGRDWGGFEGYCRYELWEHRPGGGVGDGASDG